MGLKQFLLRTTWVGVLLGVPSVEVLATTQGSIQLRGRVQQNAAISVRQGAMRSPIQMNTGDQELMTFVEQNNGLGGYEILISSANGGILLDDSGHSVPYTISYGSDDEGYQGGWVTSRPNRQPTTFYVSGARTGPTSLSHKLKVKLNPSSDRMGRFRQGRVANDQLTVTISIM